MITPAYAQTMAAYNGELNRRVFGAALRLDAGARTADGGVFWRSIHGTLSHIYWADRQWLSRFGVGTATGVPLSASDALFAEFDALWTERQALDGDIARWAAGLTQADIEGDLTWHSGATGKEMTKPRALCIMQIFNHQTHHRGQAHALITRAGEKTGDTDLPFVLP